MPALRDVLGSETTLFDPSLGEVESELSEVRADMALWEREGVRVVSVLDDDYPLNLRSVHDRPALLFVKGKLLSEDARGVSIIGSRKATAVGLRDAHEIGRRFADAGFTVYSGLAEGVDTAAHMGAIEAGGRTVAVIGTGLRKAYPRQNAKLQSMIADRYAVVSQFWPDQPPTKRTFPQRNAVMSGLSLATLVVEASNTSGARIQGRLSLAHGRPVIFLRRALASGWARECAARPGTYVVAAADEAIERVELMVRHEATLGAMARFS